MLGFLWRMIVGRFSMCDHQWETVEVRPVVNWAGDERKVTDRFQRYILRCKKCGDVSKRDLNG
jgi:hypothetical protein